jgi:hypothetical protein
MRTLALATLATIMVGMFGGELLDPIGVPGIWFPFGIGVSRTQYIYAIAVPLLAFLILRTLPSARSVDEELVAGAARHGEGAPTAPTWGQRVP